MDACAPGQRWISNTEPELGLGIVFEVADRRVVMTFPAGDERRTYVLENAPLTRVRYRVADRIRSEDGGELIVSAIEEREKCLVYTGINHLGQEQHLHEIDLDSFVQFSRPLERLFTGQIDKNARFILRQQTLAHRHQLQTSPVSGLLGPRVQLLPHQFYIADQVAQRHAPRVLLADEVGLGKTIEAGLIMHRLMLTGRAERVLVVVPDNLIHQWLVEMLRRFNLHFSIIDSDTATELEAEDGANPFESAQLILIPLHLLVGEPKRLQQAQSAGWDLLVVDEAHHLRWEESAASPEYTAIQQLADATPALLLLTATPEQLGVSGHFARLALLDPHRYSSLQAFIAEEAQYTEVSHLVERLGAANEELEAETTAALNDYLGEQRVDAFLSDADRDPRALIRELLDRHGTGRVLFRNCRDNIKGFPQRRLHTYELDQPKQYDSQLADRPVEAWLTPECGEDEAWLEYDPRVAWLINWVKAHRGEKSLLICAEADTAQSLEAWVKRRGIRSAVFHEGLDLIQRDRAAAYFADQEEDCEILICSEIGSEGRNFQFAHHLIMFDLPLNPDLLEQRIGRLDRIGQAHTIEIHVPVFTNSVSQVLAAWLHRGINAFEAICPAGPVLFAEFSERLRHCLAKPQDRPMLEALITDSAARTSELLAVLQAGRDRLIEMNSFDPHRAAVVVDMVAKNEAQGELRSYMDQVFDAFGVEHEDNDTASEVLHPGDHMACENFPGLPEGGITATFSREQALGRDDMHFLTWEHPMVSGAMDMVLGGEFGNAAVGVLKNPRVRAGTALLECLFVIVCPAPSDLRVERFLSQSNLRIVIDSHGEDITSEFETEQLNLAIQDVPGRTAQKITNRMRTQIEQLADQATHFCEVQQEPIVRAARALAQDIYLGEIERLRQLSELNPNIRAEEITQLASDNEASQAFLGNAQLKLDAVRVVIAV